MALEAAGRPPEETLSLWKREQARLKARVVNWDTEAWQRDPAFSGLQRVGGVDVSFVKGDSVRACASLVVLSFPELEVVYEESRMVSLTAPYVSGFLAFREVPFLLELVQQLREKEPGLMPQVLLVDGNGVLHHRGDPALGGPGRALWGRDGGEGTSVVPYTKCWALGLCRQSLPAAPFWAQRGLTVHSAPPPLPPIRLLQTRGDSFPLLGDSGTVLGMALRSHDRSTRPLYVSVGHKMSLEAAVRLICCCCRFRIPEPVRQADICSREHIRKSLGLPGSPTPRSPKAQRPVACPRGDSGESSGEGQPPQDHSPGPRTAPRPGSQEQAGKDWQ
nr:endonuclease V isoform X3 [Pongo abelii]